MNPKISVIIPTFHRPQGAAMAIESLFAQKNAPSFEIILIDNDKNASAETVASELEATAKELGINLIYHIEPRAGVANARNTALKFASGEYIAFLDDDEIAFENWLWALDDAQQKTNAEVVFGPIEARLEDGHSEPKEYFINFFSRYGDTETKLIDKPQGCGNSYMHREKILMGETPFNTATNETGGEDDLLWREVNANGYKYAWAHEAWVYEEVPKSRAAWPYVTRRAFAYGHNTTAQCFDKRHPDYASGFSWMIKGSAQTILMAPVALALRLINHPKWAWAYDKMLRGLGKVLWFGPFKQSFYGNSSMYIKKKKA